jgi:hypothetical protein
MDGTWHLDYARIHANITIERHGTIVSLIRNQIARSTHTCDVWLYLCEVLACIFHGRTLTDAAVQTEGTDRDHEETQGNEYIAGFSSHGVYEGCTLTVF